jgi:hypothetical protein
MAADVETQSMKRGIGNRYRDRAIYKDPLGYRLNAVPKPSSIPASVSEEISEFPNTSHKQEPCPIGSTASQDGEFERMTTYEFIDSRELARRLSLPSSWIRDQVRARSQDPLPHVNFGKYVRFLWGSPDLENWVARRIVRGNNRRVGRVP